MQAIAGLPSGRLAGPHCTRTLAAVAAPRARGGGRGPGSHPWCCGVRGVTDAVVTVSTRIGLFTRLRGEVSDRTDDVAVCVGCSLARARCRIAPMMSRRAWVAARAGQALPAGIQRRDDLIRRTPDQPDIGTRRSQTARGSEQKGIAPATEVTGAISSGCLGGQYRTVMTARRMYLRFAPVTRFPPTPTTTIRAFTPIRSM